MAHDFELDRASEVPVGTQLVWRMRALIASGRLGPADRLPGVRELAEAAGVNVNTVRSVYGRLADQGLIVSEHGRGTFVAESLPPRDELARITQEAADSARLAGIDPRELAAALFAAPADAKAAAGTGAGGADVQPFAAEARRRSALRTEIARLEREVAALDLPGDAPAEPAAAQRPGRPTPQLLTAAELESIRDDLADRIASRRADRTVARDERKRPRLDPAEPARRNRGIGADAPTIVADAGGWTLRW
jgi:DNA-binding transcriptional regulator YhcF (GntR family)